MKEDKETGWDLCPWQELCKRKGSLTLGTPHQQGDEPGQKGASAQQVWQPDWDRTERAAQTVLPNPLHSLLRRASAGAHGGWALELGL